MKTTKTASRLLENTARWRKTKRGLLTNLYHKMRERHTVWFDRISLYEFADCKKFNRLFKEWENAGYDKQLKPSIDRISNKKEYTIDNIQWLTWAENRYKQTMERRSRKGKVAQILGDKTVKVFASQREAVRETGLSQSQMSKVLNNKGITCGGYKWKYIFDNPELING